jgi:hypothetical protein
MTSKADGDINARISETRLLPGAGGPASVHRTGQQRSLVKIV